MTKRKDVTHFNLSDPVISKEVVSGNVFADYEKKEVNTEDKAGFAFLWEEINTLNQDVEKKFSNIVKTEEDLKKSIDENKIKIVESLGIFVALFTFVSLEFRIFSIYSHPCSIVGVTLIFLGSLLLFATVLDFLLNFQTKEKSLTKSLQNDAKFKLTLTVGVLFLLLIFAGILFVSFSPEKGELNEKFEKINKVSEMDKTIEAAVLTIKELENFKLEQENKTNDHDELLDCLKHKGYFSQSCF